MIYDIFILRVYIYFLKLMYSCQRCEMHSFFVLKVGFQPTNNGFTTKLISQPQRVILILLLLSLLLLVLLLL